MIAQYIQSTKNSNLCLDEENFIINIASQGYTLAPVDKHVSEVIDLGYCEPEVPPEVRPQIDARPTICLFADIRMQEFPVPVQLHHSPKLVWEFVGLMRTSWCFNIFRC
jgi:hypothetical protein